MGTTSQTAKKRKKAVEAVGFALPFRCGLSFSHIQRKRIRICRRWPLQPLKYIRKPLSAAMRTATTSSTIHQRWVVRYRGFVLIPQNNLTWLVRPERSPMTLLPFRAPASSVDDVKALIDWRLDQAS